MDSGLFFSIFYHCEIVYFWTFVSIYHTVNGRFVAYLAKWLTPTRSCVDNILGQIRQTSGCGLIPKSGFASGSVLVQILALAEVCALWVLLLACAAVEENDCSNRHETCIIDSQWLLGSCRSIRQVAPPCIGRGTRFVQPSITCC